MLTNRQYWFYCRFVNAVDSAIMNIRHHDTTSSCENIINIATYIQIYTTKRQHTILYGYTETTSTAQHMSTARSNVAVWN